eukprot:4021396-Pleurochrysis_carterae.AAC.1
MANCHNCSRVGGECTAAFARPTAPIPAAAESVDAHRARVPIAHIWDVAFGPCCLRMELTGVACFAVADD